jgi:hypothetical protein
MYKQLDIEQSINVTIVPENWERSEGVFTSNELVDAYENGMRKGRTLQQKMEEKIFEEKVNTNAKLATEIAEKFYSFFIPYNTFPHIRLRANSVTSFDLAFILEEDFYNSDHLTCAYDTAHELRQKHSTDTFSIYIYLFPKTKSLDLNKMDSDGFSLFYEPKFKKTAF